MSYIQIEHLAFSYPDSLKPIFSDLSFHVDSDWKLGLVGRNGTGKTTFLNLLRGELKPEGKIVANLPFRYFPHPVQDYGKFAYEIAAEAAPDAEFWQIQREAHLLDLNDELLYRPFCTLSGGERTRLLLAASFAGDGYPLLDEPTDHLDRDARALLAEYLAGKKGYLVVSHDRAFLNACCDHILSFGQAGAEIVKGNYGVWREERDKTERANESEKERLEKERRRLAAASKRTAAWAEKAEGKKYNGDAKDGKRAAVTDRGFLGAKAAKLQKRAKISAARTDNAERKIKELLTGFEEKSDIVLSPADYHKNEILCLKDITVKFGERTLFSHFDLSLSAGERVAVVGANGTGKSTLFKLIAGEFCDFTGERNISPRLVISYIPQIVAPSGTLSDFARECGVWESYFMALLSKIGFDARDFTRDMQLFSEGQKKKALIARCLAQRAHLYLLDEPLNYLDVTAREQFEKALISSGATVLFAEHDEAFLQAVATRKLRLPRPDGEA